MFERRGPTYTDYGSDAPAQRLRADGKNTADGGRRCMFWNNRQAIVDFINAAGVPALYPEREYAESGGLMAYGAYVSDNFRAAAGYVHRMLKGENSADLPIQEPVKVELIINLKTAKALGLEIPVSLLGRADQVIE
jgi:putative tryptophan/tyrosine transport system substrate-binding protein